MLYDECPKDTKNFILIINQILSNFVNFSAEFFNITNLKHLIKRVSIMYLKFSQVQSPTLEWKWFLINMVWH